MPTSVLAPIPDSSWSGNRKIADYLVRNRCGFENCDCAEVQRLDRLAYLSQVTNDDDRGLFRCEVLSRYTLYVSNRHSTYGRGKARISCW